VKRDGNSQKSASSSSLCLLYIIEKKWEDSISDRIDEDIWKRGDMYITNNQKFSITFPSIMNGFLKKKKKIVFFCEGKKIHKHLSRFDYSEHKKRGLLFFV
jgi:hypothetical protein